MSPELMSFVTRVLERALQKGGYVAAQVYEAGEMPPPDDALVDSLAGHLITFVTRMDTAYTSPPLLAEHSSASLEQERARGDRLAKALGACECWGETLTCARCSGRGAPGWQLPERGEFEALVRPALRKVSHFRLAAHNGRPHSPRY